MGKELTCPYKQRYDKWMGEYKRQAGEFLNDKYKLANINFELWKPREELSLILYSITQLLFSFVLFFSQLQLL